MTYSLKVRKCRFFSAFFYHVPSSEPNEHAKPMKIELPGPGLLLTLQNLSKPDTVPINVTGRTGKMKASIPVPWSQVQVAIQNLAAPCQVLQSAYWKPVCWESPRTKWVATCCCQTVSKHQCQKQALDLRKGDQSNQRYPVTLSTAVNYCISKEPKANNKFYGVRFF